VYRCPFCDVSYSFFFLFLGIACDVAITRIRVLLLSSVLSFCPSFYHPVEWRVMTGGSIELRFRFPVDTK